MTTAREALDKLKADLEYRMPGSKSPLGALVLSRVQAQAIVDALASGELQLKGGKETGAPAEKSADPEPPDPQVPTGA